MRSKFLILLWTAAIGVVFLFGFFAVRAADKIEAPAYLMVTLENGDDVIDIREIPESRVPEFSGGVGFQYDGIRWLGFVPEGACDTLRECAEAIDDTCEATNHGSGKLAEVDVENDSCGGQCSDGAGVSIHCFSPR